MIKSLAPFCHLDRAQITGEAMSDELPIASVSVAANATVVVVFQMKEKRWGDGDRMKSKESWLRWWGWLAEELKEEWEESKKEKEHQEEDEKSYWKGGKKLITYQIDPWSFITF